ncbi:MAG: laccase domain-containing protein, partial [Acidimicrobiia bacterium]|nr:laccase domain-containing protein [Acidimicrobiia bacterium]
MSFRGAAFSAAPDGDVRHDSEARSRFSNGAAAPLRWATLDQVHGSVVAVAVDEGPQGRGDALITEIPDLTVAVFTADCVGVVVEAADAVAVIHAGWRGAAAGVVEATLQT